MDVLDLIINLFFVFKCVWNFVFITLVDMYIAYEIMKVVNRCLVIGEDGAESVLTIDVKQENLATAGSAYYGYDIT